MSFDFSTVTYDKLVATAEDLVEEKGKDFVYLPPNGSDCVYVEKNEEDNSAEPSCFVGQIFFRLGMPISELESWDHAITDVGIENLLKDRYNNPLDSKSAKFLTKLQIRQDLNNTWNDSLLGARVVAESESY